MQKLEIVYKNLAETNSVRKISSTDNYSFAVLSIRETVVFGNRCFGDLSFAKNFRLRVIDILLNI